MSVIWRGLRGLRITRRPYTEDEMASFENAFQKTVLQNEGPYDNNPKDPGGETVYGITMRDNPTWRGWPLVNALKTHPGFPGIITASSTIMQAVREFYCEGPWAAVRGSDIVNQAVANELFDSAVNCGSRRAVGWLQRALNVFNRGHKDYADVPLTRVLDDPTLAALQAHLAKRGPELIFKALNALQGVYYIEIAENNENLEDFEAGWWAHRVQNFVE